MKTLTSVALIAIALGTSLWLGYRWGRDEASSSGYGAKAPAAASASEPDVLYWYDPMVPDQHFDKPGKSPFMDMLLVPKYANETGEAGVRIDAGTQQNLGIRTAKVEIGELTEQLRVPGTLQWDLRGEYRLSARTEAIVERLLVRAPYQRVKRGEALAVLLAPALSSALAEYRALAAGESTEARGLRAAARSRLRLLGLDDAELAVATNAAIPRIVVRATVDGLLSEINVREGETVMAGQALFRLNATEQMWLEARIPQADTGNVMPGTAVEVRVSAFPDARFHGRVDALLPDLDAATRTQAARIVLDNRDGRLNAGMFAEALLAPADGQRCPLVPSDALILTGREARVIVVDSNGAFRPVRVRTGRQVGERTEILEGLVGGEQLVVSGQFLIDSEASLSGAMSRLGESEPGDDTQHLDRSAGKKP